MGKRGRPPGSKNKPKAAKVVARRGRPPGSKNKPKVNVAATDVAEVKTNRGSPARLPVDMRCSCGRNLLYPLERKDHLTTCRCGKIYTDRLQGGAGQESEP